MAVDCIQELNVVGIEWNTDNTQLLNAFNRQAQRLLML